MSTSKIILCFSFLNLAAMVRAATPELVVAPGGDDAAAGSRKAPLATLAAAVARSRTLRPAGQPATIHVQSGDYRLAATLELGPQDSGLTIEGDRTAPVVLSGGRRVMGWTPWKGKILKADLAAAGIKDLSFQVLYYNGLRTQWARTPNYDPAHPRTGGFLQNAAVVEPGTKTKLVYREGELHPERWAHPERAWVRFHDRLNYTPGFSPLKSVDPTRRIIEAERGRYELSLTNPFFVCGLLEELDAPGEWCVDPETRTLYFYPPAGDPNAADEVVVPVLASLISLTGKPTPNLWVEGVRISGLDLRDSTGPAILMRGVRDGGVARCDIRNVGVGVYIGDDTHRVRVAGCDITSTLDDGVTIEGSTPDLSRVTGHVVDNCYIWDVGWGGFFNGHCSAIRLVRALRCQVTHNRVHDTPRMALTLANTGDCELSWNVAHHSGRQTLDAAIVWGDTTYDWPLPLDEQRRRLPGYSGNTIHHNRLYDSGGWGSFGHRQCEAVTNGVYTWGIYLDSLGSNFNIHDNIISDTPWGGYHVHGGQNNTFENNICLNAKGQQLHLNNALPGWPAEETRGNIVRRNVVAYRAGPLSEAMQVQAPRSGFALDDNLYWAGGARLHVNGTFAEPYGADAHRGIPHFGWLPFARWQQLEQDVGSIVADPQFVDAQQGDYRFKPTSPALALGIRQIDLTAAGPYASADRRTWPRPEEPVVRDVFDYTPSFGNRRFRDYEDIPLGNSETEAPLRQNWTPEKGNIEVVDTTAAGGKRSLRFTDVAGLPRKELPYVVYSLPITTGKATVAFDLRWEQGAIMQLDWRDDPYAIGSGPTIATTAAGMLTANGQPLLQLPAGQWLHLAMACPLGEPANGTYDLTVTLPGAAPQVFRDLAGPPAFKRLECLVLSAAGDAPGVFYIDNLDFRD